MSETTYDYVSTEKKWQDAWFKNEIYKASKKTDEKCFIHFAYPGVSGYLHVGHMRGFTYCDIIARYKRMTGYDVLFPAGFHASGIPSVGFSKKVERKDPATIKILRDYGCSDDCINSLTDPKEVVRYFASVYVEDYWKKFGFLIDYSRIMSTISEGYKKFIQWQFHKLHHKNLLIQKPHFAPFCPKCGPVAVDKSETDISSGGNAEILEFTVIKFRLDDGTILPTATLRPETIFGVTNIWINPDVTYVKINVNDEIWITSKEGAEKLTHQQNQVSITKETINGKDLIGKTCHMSLLDRTIPLLSGPFADPTIATGIVMSVPAHAPYDYIALVETKQKIDPITIITVKDLGENPARKICEEMNISSQQETAKLEEATELVYKKEFHTGILNEKCGKYAGIKVSEIKDQVKNRLIEQNDATLLREFSEDVICRCGEQVVIKQIPDQWFIKYSDKKLTTESKEHVKTMNISPEEYKEELPGILDWFDDRACIRKGSWLGTEFPFKKGWIVEPISDSTLYPVYYIISKYVNENKIKPEEMTEAFFDYVFLNQGETTNPIWKEIQDDFHYWYPVDINLGGKEHKTVHFPVFIMNHVAILPEKNRPQGIFVHWWVTQKGKEKISKSKGGAEHVAEAANIYGIDAMRLYYTHVGSPFVDIEWDSAAVTKYKKRIISLFQFIQRLRQLDKEPNSNLDHWLKSKMNRHIHHITTQFDSYNLRVAANEIYFEMYKTLQWYRKRGGGNKKIIQWFTENWIRLMTPVTPHIAEELWHQTRDSFVSTMDYPTFDATEISEKDEVGEYLLSQLVQDTQEILKVTKMTPKKICYYISPAWKKEVMLKAIDLAKDGSVNVGKLMKDVMKNEHLRRQGKQVSKYAGKLPKEITRLQDHDKKRYQTDINEHQYLKQTIPFLNELFDCDIEIYDATDKERYDPQQKASFAAPLRPAIYVE
ncbi:MAG: leucine--tRNA ligase [Thermoplasmatota archaeon]